MNDTAPEPNPRLLAALEQANAGKLVEHELDDNDDTEVEAEILLGPADDYPWSLTRDGMLRTFVFQTLSDASHIPREAILQMQQYVDWIATGAIPEMDKPKRKAHLKPVDE